MTSPADLPDYAPIPQSALGPALNEQGYYVGRVERNLYWVTDGASTGNGRTNHIGSGTGSPSGFLATCSQAARAWPDEGRLCH